METRSLRTKLTWRVDHGWIGEPHRNRYRDFDTRRAAEEYQAKWLAGGKNRSARKPKLVRVAREES